MFYSTYVPVNVTRMSCAIYSNEKFFPKKFLLRAKNYLSGETTEPGVYMENGVVSFIDNPDFAWTVPDVYLANNALEVAEKSNFSYYIVHDLSGIPQFFVSQKFAGQRSVVNALTMRTLLLTDSQLIDKVASMIDRKYPKVYCQDFFHVLEDLVSNKSKYLTGLIVGSESADEYLVLNQHTIVHGEIIQSISRELLNEMQEIIDGATETESFSCFNNYITRKDVNYWPTMHIDYAKSLIEIHAQCKEKKSNYVPISDENYEDALYFSTNKRYLVHARTLECVTVTNVRVKAVLQEMITHATNTSADINMIWSLACEVR